MYFQRDYILRMIEMIGELARRILDNAREEDARAELDEISRKASGMPLKTLKTADVSTLETLLSPEQRYLCAELLLIGAQVDARTQTDDAVNPARAQALSLLATLQTPDYLPRACDRAHSAMEEMLDFLAPAELAALAALFERGGRFAAAEDALWAAENRAALAAFYRRLLAMDDAALCAGNLPREEILEAVRALEGDEGNAGS